jgi:hypothetical protein
MEENADLHKREFDFYNFEAAEERSVMGGMYHKEVLVN